MQALTRHTGIGLGHGCPLSQEHQDRRWREGGPERTVGQHKRRVRGAHATYYSKGYRMTSVGAPGTGLSCRTTKRIGGFPLRGRRRGEPNGLEIVGNCSRRSSFQTARLLRHAGDHRPLVARSAGAIVLVTALVRARPKEF